MSAPRYVDCRCGHAHGDHAGELAPQCHAKACTCVQYRPGTAPARPAVSTPPARPVAAVSPPVTGPTIEQLLASGKRSNLAPTRRLAERIEGDVAKLLGRVRNESQTERERRRREEAREAARAEVVRLERLLAEARAKARGEKPIPQTSTSPTEGGVPCPDCPRTFSSEQGLAIHRGRSHVAKAG